MRGEASRVADRSSRDELAPKLAALKDQAGQVANELFVITNILDHNARLQRALTDQSRSKEDKVALLKSLFSDQVQPTTMEIMSDLVSRRWSRAYDIDNAVEDFAVDAMMYKSDADNETLRVSVELAELQSALLNLPVVRSDLSDDKAPAEARIALLNSLIGDKDFSPITKRLAEHCTCNLRKRRYLESIQWLINKYSRHMGESMVTVTTAKALSQAQIDKLIEIYSAKVGHRVHINSVVDPKVLGGMRIQVGDQVTDNTVIAQIENLKRKAASGNSLDV